MVAMCIIFNLAADYSSLRVSEAAIGSVGVRWVESGPNNPPIVVNPGV